MARETIQLTTQEDLKVFMSPQRQRLIRKMQVAGKPVTAKNIADMLGVSTSSAQFHIRKLQALGIVELDHSEVINGIVAKFFKLAEVNVSIGTRLDDKYSNERYAVMQNIVKGTLENMIGFLQTDAGREDKDKKNSAFISGFLRLTPKDAQELISTIKTYIETHEKTKPGTQAWEFSLMMYNAGAGDKADQKESDE